MTALSLPTRPSLIVISYCTLLVQTRLGLVLSEGVFSTRSKLIDLVVCFVLFFIGTDCFWLCQFRRCVCSITSLFLTLFFERYFMAATPTFLSLSLSPFLCSFPYTFFPLVPNWGVCAVATVPLPFFFLGFFSLLFGGRQMQTTMCLERLSFLPNFMTILLCRCFPHYGVISPPVPKLVILDPFRFSPNLQHPS